MENPCEGCPSSPKDCIGPEECPHVGTRARVKCLIARVANLESRLSSLDCRYAGGGIGEVSGSHCPADAPCDRCVAERRVAELESVRDDLSRAYAVQGLALEEERGRVAELEAWQLAIAEGTQFINRAEGQDGYEVADPQTILKHFEEEAHERDALRKMASEFGAALISARARVAELEADAKRREDLIQDNRERIQVLKARVAETKAKASSLRENLNHQ